MVTLTHEDGRDRLLLISIPNPSNSSYVTANIDGKSRYSVSLKSYWSQLTLREVSEQFILSVISVLD